MATNGVALGSVYGKLILDITDWNKGIADAQKSASGLAGTIADTSKTATANVAGMGAGASKLPSIFSSVGKGIAGAFGQVDSAISSSIGFLSNFKLAGVGIAAGFGIALKKGLDVSGDIQQATSGLKTLLGSYESAQQAVEKFKKDAATTPFDFRGIIKANQMLISTGEGVDASREAVLALGNAIVATGGGQGEFDRLVQNLQQIKNVGGATALDIKQFGFAGINILDLLSKSTGKTTAQLADMDITYEMIVQSLKKAQGEGGKFAGALTEQANGWNLLKSNLGDVVNIILSDILTGSGIFQLFNDGLKGLVDFLTNNKDAIVGFFKEGVDMVRNIVSKIIELGRAFTQSAFFKFLVDNGDTILTFLKGAAIAFGVLLGTVLALGAAIQIITAIGTAITFLTSPLGIILVVAGLLYLAWQKNFLGIRDIVAVVVQKFMEFVAFVKALPQTIATFVETTKAKWEEFKQNFINGVIGIKDAFVNFFTVTLPEAIVNFFTVTLPSMLVAGVKAFADFLVNVAGAILEGFGFILGLIIFGVPKLIEAYINFWLELPGRIWAVMLWLGDLLIKGIQMMWDFITVTVPKMWNDFIKFAADMVVKIKAKLVDAFNAFVKWLSDTWNWIKVEVPRIVTGIVTWISELPAKIGQGLSNLYNTMKTKFIEAFTGVKDEVATWPSKMTEWGTNVAKAFVEGFSKIGEWIRDKVKAGLEKAKKLLEGHSPPVAGPFKDIDVWGGNVARAWVTGFTDVFDTLDGSLGSRLAGVSSSVSSLSGGLNEQSFAPVTIQVNMDTYLGTPAQKRQIAKEIFDAYEDYKTGKGGNA